MTKLIRPVILAGGSGTRLWPVSTSARPKHLLKLVGSASLLEQTLDRVGDRRRFADPIVVCGASHADEIRVIGPSPVRIIVEPAARNTAAAIGLAAASVQPDELLLILPSDHHISEPLALMHALDLAAPAAEDGWIVTFGVRPEGPETGYGYISVGEAISEGLFMAKSFIEKPDRTKAEQLIRSGGNFWNAGIFLMRAEVILAELELHQPRIRNCATEAMAKAREKHAMVHPQASALLRCPSLSIDHAVMEHSRRVAVLPVEMAWSDVGNWSSVYEASPKDADGNVVSAGSQARDCRGCLVQSSGPRIVALGVEGLVIVASASEILVVPRSEAQRVREAAAASADSASAGSGPAS